MLVYYLCVDVIVCSQGNRPEKVLPGVPPVYCDRRVFTLSTSVVLVSHQCVMTLDRRVFTLSTSVVLVSHQCVMTGESLHSLPVLCLCPTSVL